MDAIEHSRPVSPAVGLIPAAGRATRLGSLPCSKEIYPVGWEESRPKVASHYVLEDMRRGGIETAYIVLREGKWDIPTYWGDGRRVGVHLAYVMMGAPHGTPFSLDQAFPFVQNRRVALGFPDILMTPGGVYAELLDRQTEGGADVVLGLFPAHRPEKVDMVDLDDSGRPRRFVIKPKATTLQYTWLCAVWTPAFTFYLHSLIQDIESDWSPDEELFLGDVFDGALDSDIEIDAVCFPDGKYVDIGTPDALAKLRDGEDKAELPVR